MMKYLLLVIMVSQSYILLAAQCKVCGRYANANGYCTMHKNEEKKASRKNEYQQKSSTQQSSTQQSLKLKSFVGYKFLSKGESGKVEICKLATPFRGFDEAKLYYSSMGRLYQIALEDAVEGRTGEEIENELTSIAVIFEKKYHFTFPAQLSCDNGISETGGGHYIGSGGTIQQARRKYTKLKKISWYRNMEWEDFKLNLHGEKPNGTYGTNNISRVTITFTMKGIKEADKKQATQKAAQDIGGIDSL